MLNTKRTGKFSSISLVVLSLVLSVIFAAVDFAAPAPDLVNWNGNLVADFGDNGLWYHDGDTWHWMTNNGHVCRMVVWNGKLVTDFGDDKGLWYYDGSWQWMTNKSNPNTMITWDNGTSEVLVVDFGAGQRVFTYDGSWHWFTNKDGVNDMLEWDNKLVVDFGTGRGLYL